MTMNKDLAIRLTAYALCPLLLILVGCARTQTARFYTLNALTDAPAESEAVRSEQGIALGLGPIQMPEYLDRPQIVTRAGPNEVRFAEFHRWAEALAGDFSSTLAENLSILLATNRIALYPWKSTTQIDWRVEIVVTRFDGRPGDRVILQCQWTVLSRDRGQAWLTKTSALSEPVAGKGYEALVSAHSRTVGALSREIAEAIKALPQDAIHE
jgi:uncharacterized lipoprotein YmbA